MAAAGRPRTRLTVPSLHGLIWLHPIGARELLLWLLWSNKARYHFHRLHRRPMSTLTYQPSKSSCGTQRARFGALLVADMGQSILALASSHGQGSTRFVSVSNTNDRLTKDAPTVMGHSDLGTRAHEGKSPKSSGLLSAARRRSKQTFFFTHSEA